MRPRRRATPPVPKASSSRIHHTQTRSNPEPAASATKKPRTDTARSRAAGSIASNAERVTGPLASQWQSRLRPRGPIVAQEALIQSSLATGEPQSSRAQPRPAQSLLEQSTRQTPQKTPQYQSGLDFGSSDPTKRLHQPPDQHLLATSIEAQEPDLTPDISWPEPSSSSTSPEADTACSELSLTESQRLRKLEALLQLYLSHGIDLEDMPEAQQVLNKNGSAKGSEKEEKLPKDPTRLSAKSDTKAYREALTDFGISRLESDSDPTAEAIAKDVQSDCTWCQKHSISEDEKTEWKKDLARSKDSPEVLFQHTIMMDILQRHKLDLSTFEYSCDTQFVSKSFPRWYKTPGVKLAKPKPDLTVGFSPKNILKDQLPNENLLGSLRSYMLPENVGKRPGCAFPFFFVEAKGPGEAPGEDVAGLQAKNDAAQALYNIYKYMRSDALKKQFVKSVRVFTATAYVNKICIDMHRATPRHLLQNKTELDVRKPELWYERIQVVEFGGSERLISKSEVLSSFHNILKYAKGTLQPILKTAVTTEIQRVEAAGGPAAAHVSPPESPPAAPRPKRKRSEPTGARESSSAAASGQLEPSSPHAREESASAASIQADPAASFQSNDSTNRAVGNMSITGSDPESVSASHRLRGRRDDRSSRRR